ncbi:pyruvate dehydrogenase complex dihydrolipoamide acetyltransferase [Candidatus Bodocaedibacter vickermanii]|uniref:Acetyltransferase component of pyruvate dehydrogenase complex n=1 Tax=Candidatus Bodocaedibacter vickermanii TaxID=2741701 RepID=A0A7L9RV29_9PROT|nr:Dihydrolipoyllysine-residue acetyltransferase component of pyruvate dehydrogenase complex [Candidatus Paracaedibacteraceae bacterium 'Lake Konstanz']
MPIEILMPALSPTMEEGNLVKWHKKEGDTITAGTVIAEIETDKATMEVEAVDEGILGKILIPEGTDSVKVNTLIALLLEKGEDASALTGYVGTTVASSQTVEKTSAAMVEGVPVLQSSIASSDRVFATPLAKRIAEQKGVDLQHVEGSGPHGRVIKADVESFYPKAIQATSPILNVGGHHDVKLSNMRKVIAKRLTESKQSIPHFYLTLKCELDKVLAMRSEINVSREKDTRISVNDFVIKALAMALATTEDANVMWLGDAMRHFNTVDMSVAVAIDGGLVTPIIKNAELKTLSQISSEMRDLAVRARAGKLKPEEFQGGTFSLSNLGMYGIDEFSAIINPPQAGILAVGAGVEQPVIKDGNVSIATIMTATLSVDHRAIDGAVGARLLGNFKKFIENPVRMLV